jgi:hypothetical protein
LTTQVLSERSLALSIAAVALGRITTLITPSAVLKERLRLTREFLGEEGYVFPDELQLDQNDGQCDAQAPAALKEPPSEEACEKNDGERARPTND